MSLILGRHDMAGGVLEMYVVYRTMNLDTLRVSNHCAWIPNLGKVQKLRLVRNDWLVIVHTFSSWCRYF
jgi:hypothetical protein